MKKLLFILLIISVALAGCTSSSTVNNTTTTPGDGSQTPTGQMKTFDMTAKQFEFSPATIEVNVGDTVVLNITSTDVEHGIAIPQFGVSKTLPVGQTVTVQFVADKAGTFPFFCNVFCGADHKSMKGSLIVK